jgi:hypothetical protein
VASNGYQTTDLRELAGLDPKKLVGKPLSSAFGIDDRLFVDFTDFETVYDSANTVSVRDMAEMLSIDGTAKKLEQVLTLPIRGADSEIKGDGPEADLVRANVGPMLGRLIDQCTAAIWARRSYFEKVWTTNDGGRYVYERIAWRPPASCDAAFDAETANPTGFKQYVGMPMWTRMTQAQSRGADATPGWARVPTHKAFVYTHGQHREPVRGVSDLDVSYRAYELKQKLKFLWGQHLENTSLPRLVVYGRDRVEAQNNAELHGKARASGIIPQVANADLPKSFDVVESSGQGAGQFETAIRYLEQEQTNSVLAGFTDLTQAASQQGVGSKALSSDQSEFFLAARQAVADEIAHAITCDVFAPLVVLNFGVDAPIPQLSIGPIGNAQTDRALAVLRSLLVATTVNAPENFMDQLLGSTSSYLGLRSDDLAQSIGPWREQQAAGA